jgi:hypothetical protein
MITVEQAPIAEPFVVQDIYATGLLRVEDIGAGTFRFVFYVNQVSTFGEPERVIVSRLVMPADAAREGSRASLKALGRYFLRNCVECLKQSCH